MDSRCQKIDRATVPIDRVTKDIGIKDDRGQLLQQSARQWAGPGNLLSKPALRSLEMHRAGHTRRRAGLDRTMTTQPRRPGVTFTGILFAWARIPSSPAISAHFWSLASPSSFRTCITYHWLYLRKNCLCCPDDNDRARAMAHSPGFFSICHRPFVRDNARAREPKE